MGVNVVYEWSKQQIHISKNTFYLVEKPKIGSFLIINVKSAKNLKNADLFGTSDPYFICKFTDGWSDNQKNRLFRGSSIHNNLNPEWNAKICVELKEAIGDELKFEFLIFDYDHRLKIGKILVKVDSLEVRTIFLVCQTRQVISPGSIGECALQLHGKSCRWFARL